MKENNKVCVWVGGGGGRGELNASDDDKNS